MRNVPSVLSACIVLACGYAMSPAADAATVTAWSVNGGAACQLSIPTTNTGVRPKATGFRNESASVSNFVICPINSSVTPQGASTFTNLFVFLQSIDGTSRSITCTAVVGGDSFGSGGAAVYSSKTMAVGASVVVMSWDGIDFGGTSGTAIAGSGISSVTCNLPAQMSIQHTEGRFLYDIGT